MAETVELTLVPEVRSFGWRAFDLADRYEAHAATTLVALRESCSLASRDLASRTAAAEPRAAHRATERAFKRLHDAVRLLDEVATRCPDAAVEASALAIEATDLAERVYELCAAR